ncbi:hypothetical protein AAY473_037575 [Plecturocebus cupreus]
MGSGRGETPSTSISIFPFTGGQDKSGAETWQRRPAAPQLPVARMARRGGAASRAPSLLPPLARAPRGSARLLGSGTGGVWAGEREERVAACPWSAGLQAPPAVPLSRAHPGGGGASQRAPSLRAARGLALQPGPRSSPLSSVSWGPSAFPLPTNLLNKVAGRANLIAGMCPAKLARIGTVRCK